MTGRPVVLILSGQSGGQLAEFIGAHDLMIADAMRPPQPRPPVVRTGRFDVTGTMTVHFQNDALLRAMIAGQRHLDRRALLACRPYLSRRAYRRLRGRMKGKKQ